MCRLWIARSCQMREGLVILDTIDDQMIILALSYLLNDNTHPYFKEIKSKHVRPVRTG